MPLQFSRMTDPRTIAPGAEAIMARRAMRAPTRDGRLKCGCVGDTCHCAPVTIDTVNPFISSLDPNTRARLVDSVEALQGIDARLTAIEEHTGATPNDDSAATHAQFLAAIQTSQDLTKKKYIDRVQKTVASRSEGDGNTGDGATHDAAETEAQKIARYIRKGKIAPNSAAYDGRMTFYRPRDEKAAMADKLKQIETGRRKKMRDAGFA